MPALLWFRRDLRLHDNPALDAAMRQSTDGSVAGLFVIDPVLEAASGPVRLEWLRRSLSELNEQLAGRLIILRGNPREVVLRVARELAVDGVFVSRDFGNYGHQRDLAVASSLAAHSIAFTEIGSPYAVDPGSVVKDDGSRYRVYTPFYKAWLAHGYPRPTDYDPSSVPWVDLRADASLKAALSQQLGQLTKLMTDVDLPQVGEQAALDRWQWFREGPLAEYGDDRNRPDLDATSNLSAYLRWGQVHPRTLLADLAPHLELATTKGPEVFRKEIAWREFYADVLTANPSSIRKSLDRRYDTDLHINWGPSAEENFTSWCEGRTGYPFVDAGMRQLRATGWMHNRVRMVTASFFVKGLHLPWQRGAAEFMYWLRDGDSASNQHGWQWVAGCGTDAAPFYRIFNPVLQGLKFDPEGDYVRRWIPELRGLAGAGVHEPWKTVGTLEGESISGYPSPIIDHLAERGEALARFAALPKNNVGSKSTRPTRETKAKGNEKEV